MGILFSLSLSVHKVTSTKPSSSAGVVDPCELLANIDIQMNKAKDEAWSRKEIIDKIDHWLAACDEENWLEDYTQVISKCSLLTSL